MKLIKKLALAASMLLTATATTFAADADPDILQVAFLPAVNASPIIKRNQPLQDYLEYKQGNKNKLNDTSDYYSTIETHRY